MILLILNKYFKLKSNEEKFLKIFINIIDKLPIDIVIIICNYIYNIYSIHMFIPVVEYYLKYFLIN